MSYLKILFMTTLATVNFSYADSTKLENELLTESIVTSKAVGRSYLNNIYVYGVGTKSDDNAYDGIGLKYDSNISFYNFERDPDYNKSVFIHRLDVTNRLYNKFGLGFLEKEETILGQESFVEQMTSGLSLGYGDSNTYNFEIGYIVNRLDNAYNADTYTDTIYVEAVLKEDFIFGSLDSTISFQATKAYDKIEKDYTTSLGYYPIDDIKATVKYTTIEHTADQYNVNAGLNYKFQSLSDFTRGTLTPLLTASMNNSENVQTVFDYKYNISNRSLKIKDKFRELISIASIVAKDINSSVFTAKTTE